MKLKAAWLRTALKQRAAAAPEQSPTLLAMCEQLRFSPSISACRVAERLLGISDVPDFTWGKVLPSLEAGQDSLSLAIDRLTPEWQQTNLHRLVALRRVASAAIDLARAIEKIIEQEARDDQ